MNLANCILSNGLYDPAVPQEIMARWDDALPSFSVSVVPEVPVIRTDPIPRSRFGEVKRTILSMVTETTPLLAQNFCAAMPDFPRKRILAELCNLHDEQLIRRIGLPGSYQYLKPLP